MINKDSNLKEIVDKYPEIASTLGQAGLHCVGCHASASETVGEGCAAHGMDEKQVGELIKEVNDRIKLFDSLGEFTLTELAVQKLKERMKEANAKFIRLMPVYGGFDFDAVNEKFDGEILIEKEVPILTSKNLERFLRGVEIGFDEKEDDFTAKRDKKEN